MIVGCFVALEKPGVKSEAYGASTLPLTGGLTNDFVNETVKAITHQNPSGDLNYSGPDSELPNGVSQE